MKVLVEGNQGNQLNGTETDVGWKVSLSNGETLYSGKGDYIPAPDKLSPWNRLKKHMQDHDLRITSLSAYSDDGRTFNLPSAGRNPRSPIFKDQATQPIGYNFFYCATSSTNANFDDASSYIVIEAIYEKYKLQIWVDRNNPDHCWSAIVEA